MTKRKLLLVKVCVSINDWYIEWLLYSIENKSTLIKQPIVMYYLYTLNWSTFFPNITNHIGGIMVSLLALSVVEHGFEPPSWGDMSICKTVVSVRVRVMVFNVTFNFFSLISWRLF